MLRPILYLVIVLLVFFTSSCKKDKLKANDASYFLITNPSVTSPPGKGVGSNKITDIWYYVDGQFLGAYPIGNLMPIIAKNNADVTLFAGIKNNGISDTRQPYHFYEPILLSNYQLENGKTYTVSPNFTYKSTASIPVFDGFDNTIGSNFYSVGAMDYTLTTDPSKTYGGIGTSVYMTMTDAKPTAIMKSSTPLYNLPVNGSPAYIELDYKCNQPIRVGVIGGATEERTAIVLNPTIGWNTIYIQLSAVLTTPPTYNKQEIFIKAIKEVDSPEIYIDNIKIVY